MIKLFLRDSFIYTLSNLLTRGIGFIMLPIYTTFFNAEQFGVLDIFLIGGNILSVIVGLEIHQAVARFFPEQKDIKEKARLVSTAFWAITVLYIVFLIPGLFLSPWVIKAFINNTKYIEVCYYALISYGANFLYQYASSQLRWQLKSKQNLIVSILYSSLSAGIAFWFLKKNHSGIEVIFIAQTIAALVCLSLAIGLSPSFYRFVYSPPLLKKMLRFSFPLIISTLTVYGMLYIDRFIIGYFLNAENLGYYAFAYRIASVLAVVTVGVQSAITPLIYSNYKQKDSPERIAQLFHLFLGVSLAIIAFLAIFSSQIVLLIGKDKFLPSAALIPYLAASVLFTGAVNFTPGIFIGNKTTTIAYINGFSFLINIVYNVFFIKTWGLIGAAYASVISAITFFLIYFWIGNRYYPVPLFGKRPTH